VAYTEAFHGVFLQLLSLFAIPNFYFVAESKNMMK